MTKKHISDRNTKDFDFKGRVCSQCGGKLTKQIINISCPQVAPSYVCYVVCKPCSKIEYGVRKDIYPVAKKYVEERNFTYRRQDWGHDKPDVVEYYKQQNISVVCEIIETSLRMLSNN